MVKNIMHKQILMLSHYYRLHLLIITPVFMIIHRLNKIIFSSIIISSIIFLKLLKQNIWEICSLYNYFIGQFLITQQIHWFTTNHSAVALIVSNIDNARDLHYVTSFGIKTSTNLEQASLRPLHLYRPLNNAV